MTDPLARPVIVVGPPSSGQVAMRECLLRAPGTWTARLGDLVDGDPGPGSVESLRRALLQQHAELDRADVPGAPPRLVASDPVLAQWVPFLSRAFPDAQWVSLQRDPHDAIADAVAGEGLTEDLWRARAAALRADLATIDAARHHRVDTAAFLAAPDDSTQALMAALDLGWHPSVSASWRVLGRESGTLVLDDVVAVDNGLGDVLRRAGSSLLVTTYQSGRLIVLRHDAAADALGVHLRAFERPMGVAVTSDGFALGTRGEVWDYRDLPAAAPGLDPPGSHDACFLPRNAHVTGDIAVHDLELGREGLWVVATRFSALATLDTVHSFVPRWLPPWITAIAPEDRCHLNGLALVDGAPRYVTALGTTDTAGGWRAGKADGGVVVDVTTGRVVVEGLSMPHSPRWHAGRLWVLESGRGRLSVCDVAAGTTETVAELPGFTRGLRFQGSTAYVGTSQVRETATFGGLPIASLPRRECGVWAVDVRAGSRGRVLGSVRFEGRIQEIFDVAVLPGRRFPEVVEPGGDLARAAWSVPRLPAASP